MKKETPLTFARLPVPAAGNIPLGLAVSPRPGMQRGMALLVGLMLLLVLSILGLTAIRGTTQQEKMAAASMQQEMTFQAAEAGLRLVMNVLRNDPDVLGTLAGVDAATQNVTYTPVFETATALSDTATLQYVAPDQAEELGIPPIVVKNNEMGLYETKRFEVDSVASQQGTKATSNQRLGVGFISQADSSGHDKATIGYN